MAFTFVMVTNNISCHPTILALPIVASRLYQKKFATTKQIFLTSKLQHDIMTLGRLGDFTNI
jgi:hypothetical protein